MVPNRTTTQGPRPAVLDPHGKINSSPTQIDLRNVRVKNAGRCRRKRRAWKPGIRRSSWGFTA